MNSSMLHEYEVTKMNRSANPTPIRDMKLPGLQSKLGYNADSTVFSTSPETTRNIGDFLCIEVPHLTYLKYSKYHRSKKDHQGRYESESPKCNFYYFPQTLRVSPRSKVKVFTSCPIQKTQNDVIGWQVKSFKKKRNGLVVKQPKVLPSIYQKSSVVNCDINPAMTYGEKLWKLHELALMDFKVKN